ncbi:MAG: hypothetical protein EP338_04555 [Bacteroidetes bacterium]|nr:MAG: hypothetical protein EP338_04555 [Bacteroidota bacterium]
MKIITLTTDMGLEDHYVAALKGSILSADPEIRIVDISHQIAAFDLSQAAYCLASCMNDFPSGSVHLIGVDSEPVINFGSPRHSSVPAILKMNGQYVVSNDNGVFSLLLKEDLPEGVWHVDDVLSNPNAFRFPAKNVLLPIAIRLAQGAKPEEMGTAVSGFNRLIAMNPTIETNLIKGNVIHVDHYGNVITNIDKALFERFGKDIPFTIYFRRKEYFIDEISNSYNEVPPGEKLAFFNQNDLLEIAINRGAKSRNGGASTLFGLQVNDTIRVEFLPPGSKETLDALFD